MFTQDDLALNRNGKIAPSQEARINDVVLRQLFKNGAVVVIVAFVFLGFAFFMSFLSPRASARSSDVPAWFPYSLIGGIGVLLFGFVLKWVWDWGRVKQDLTDGAVSQAPGSVEWYRSNYRVVAEGRQLKMMSGVVALSPGNYHFYFLPRSGYILSAESLGQADPNQSLQSVLNTVFRFDPNDLALNLQGQLGESQVSRLQKEMWTYAIIGIVLVSAFTIVPLAVMFSSRTQSSAWIPTLIFFSVDVFVVIVFAFLAWRVWSDLSDRRVEMLNGVMRKYMVRGNKSSTYYIAIGNKKFSVGIPQYNSVIEGRVYRLYYTPRSSVVIGIEVERL